MNKPASIKSRIEYGLDAVGSDRTVSVQLRDLLFVHQTIGELIRFFHQPANFSTIEQVEQFLGSVDLDDAFAALYRCYYDLLRDVWPDDINARFDDGDFDNSASPVCDADV